MTLAAMNLVRATRINFALRLLAIARWLAAWAESIISDLERTRAS